MLTGSVVNGGGQRRRKLSQLTTCSAMTVELWLLLISIGVLYVGFTMERAWHKPFWYDEISTLTVASQDSLSQMWAAETAGFDLNPPLAYMLTKASRLIAIRQELAVRIPEIFAYLVAIVCCSLFVAARLPSPYVLPVSCFLLLSETYGYAYEARAYAIELACAAAALLSWQVASMGETSSGRRRLGRVVLSVSLATALLAHCYAIGVYFPIAAGELWRSWRNRHLDTSVWMAIVFSAVPLVFYPALLGASHKVIFGHSIFEASSRRFLGAYAFLLRDAAVPVGVSVAPVLVLALRKASLVPASVARLLHRVPDHEMIAVWCFALIPLCAFTIARTLHSAYIPRYGIAGALGFSILLAFAVFVLSMGRQKWALWVGLCTLLWFTGSFVVEARNWQREARDREYNQAQVMAVANTGRPIVMSNGGLFVESGFYFPPALSRDLVFLADRELAIRHSGSDLPDTPLLLARPWLRIPSHIEPYREFVQSHDRFWLFAPTDTPLEWIRPQLREDGFVLEQIGGTALYDVMRDPAGTHPPLR